MQFTHSIGQESVKFALKNAFEKGQVPHAQCFIDQGGRGGLALGLNCALSLLWDEIPDSREKALHNLPTSISMMLLEQRIALTHQRLQ